MFCCGRQTLAPQLRVEVPDLNEVKLVLLGDSGVGKTSLVNRILAKEVHEDHEVTIGGAFFQLPLRLDNGEKTCLNIWDTGGQERFRSLLKMYYRKAQIAFVMFDVSSSTSFESCEFWLKELNNEVSDCQALLIANKTDLHYPERRVSGDEARKLAGLWKAPYFEVSAKLGEGIEPIMEAVARTARELKG